MKTNNLKSIFDMKEVKKRRGVAEVISTLLLVVITVVGAVILTGFIDESFVAGSLSVSSSTDSTIKTIKLRGYDTRDGMSLMGYDLAGSDVNNNISDFELCRSTCNGVPSIASQEPLSGGSEFLVIQIENRGVNSIYLKSLYLDGVNHPWDPITNGQTLDTSGDSSGGAFPSDGTFSILSENVNDLDQRNNEIIGGQTVNLLIKLHSDATFENIELSKTIRVQLNIGENSLAEFLIESGDAR